MKILSTVLIILFLAVNICYSKTLVKYYKTTGDIIQTNNVDEMPSQEILNDRFRSDNTDVILVDEPVDISTQRVDLNKKNLVPISQAELNARTKATQEKQNAERLIQDKIRQRAIDALKAEGKLDAEGKIVK